MRVATFFFFIIFFIQGFFSQELSCKVEVNIDQVNGTDRRVFDAMENTILEFLNTNTWTKQEYKPYEKIEMSILIRITERSGLNNFKADFHIVARRPVYNSVYYTTILNHIDKGVPFIFSEFDRLYFTEQTYRDNLTSLLAFYVYTIIGLDYDSYKLESGTPYFSIARRIVNNAQTSSDPEWSSSGGNRNRYWVAVNFLSPVFRPFRKAFYTYHLQGLDVMWNDMPKGRKKIIESLNSINKLHNINPLSIQSTFFFNAKSDELVDIFSKASNTEKTEVLNLLQVLNPVNSSKYNKIK